MMQKRSFRCLCAAARLSGQHPSRPLSTEALSAAAPQTQTTSTTTTAESGTQDPTAETLFSEAPTEGPDSTSPPHEESQTPKQHRPWTAVKAVLTGSLVAGTVASAYVSYAFTSEQIDNKVAAVRTSAEVNDLENGDLFQRVQKVLYSTTMKAVVGVAGLYLETRKAIEDQVRGFTAPASNKLLPDLLPQERHVFTLVLDLNETLVYSDWTRDRGWRTFKRPGVDAFLEHLAQYYELVVYTDQLPFSVDPILEKLDQKGCIRYRLAREATQYIHGKHYKDLSKLNRDPARVMFLSAHATETCLQPENAVTVKPWKLETDDTTLLDLLPFFEYVARYRPADIRPVLASYSGHDIPSEFLIRTKDYQRKMRELKSQNPFFKGSRSS